MTIVWFVSDLRQKPSLPTLKSSPRIFDGADDIGSVSFLRVHFPSGAGPVGNQGVTSYLLPCLTEWTIMVSTNCASCVHSLGQAPLNPARWVKNAAVDAGYMWTRMADCVCFSASFAVIPIRVSHLRTCGTGARPGGHMWKTAHCSSTGWDRETRSWSKFPNFQCVSQFRNSISVDARYTSYWQTSNFEAFITTATACLVRLRGVRRPL